MNQDANDTETKQQAVQPGPMGRKGQRAGFLRNRLFEARLLASQMPRLVRAARLSTFVICLGAISTMFYAHRVHTQYGEQLLGAGELLMRYQGAERQDQTRVMEVNGQSIHFSTGVTTDSVDAVLDSFETICQQHDGQVMEQFARLPRSVRGHTVRMLDPVMRYGGANGGVVICLDMGEEEVSLGELRQRVQRFEHSTDVHEIGDIRYVYVQGTDDPEVRHFITVWTDGPFRMGNMMSDGVDAPGTDLTDVPRPPGSHRVISAAEAGYPEAAAMYTGSPMTEWELEGFYQHELPAHGWIVTPIRDDRQPLHSRVVTAHREGQEELLFVSLDTDEHGRGNATVAVSR